MEPNIGRTSNRARKLYANVANSVLLYGAQVWSTVVEKDKRLQAKVRAAQRGMAQRAARTYRTVSHEAVTTLAGIPPADLLAAMHKRVYEGMKSNVKRKDRETRIANRIRNAIKKQEKAKLIADWATRLSRKVVRGGEMIEEIGKRVAEWSNRKHGQMTYHMAQIITKHGCFGRYLNRIGKEKEPGCHHCPEEMDTAEHTLRKCPAWRKLKEEAEEELGKDLSLGILVPRILERKEAWEAFQKLCGGIMGRKEEAERKRRGQSRGRRKTRGNT